ncbi:MAG TPA: isopentenyl phosphate kinase [Patescibacteria group bacterium]|nr:isopentenyl phosphate kinase [Patescibacteria group bacterium]
MTQELILIKLGGSVITDKSKPYTFQEQVAQTLIKQIKKANKPVLIAHGAGSFAHTSAKKYGGTHGYTNTLGISHVSKDARELNQLIISEFLAEDMPAVSFSPMSMIVSDKGKTVGQFFESLEETIKQGIIPVVFGDVIWDKTWKSTIYSGERVLNDIAFFLLKKKYPITKIIQVGKTSGVYDTVGKTIPHITQENWPTLRKMVFGSDETDVTGGMEHKVIQAITLAKQGLSTLLINGTKENELSKALLGERVEGTLIS